MKKYTIRMGKEKKKKKPFFFLMINSYESVKLFHSCGTFCISHKAPIIWHEKTSMLLPWSLAWRERGQEKKGVKKPTPN